MTLSIIRFFFASSFAQAARWRKASSLFGLVCSWMQECFQTGAHTLLPVIARTSMTRRLWTLSEKWKTRNRKRRLIFRSGRKLKRDAASCAPWKTKQIENAGCLLFFSYRDLHVRSDLAVQLHGNLVIADDLDGIGQRDLALVDVIALGLQSFGDVGRSY